MTATLEAASTESGLATVLAGLVAAERVPVDAHFFDDLGADSMVMARFCARVRKCGDLPDVSMQDVYAHPTIGGLATALDGAAPAGDVVPAPPAVETPPRASTSQYLLCGVLQLLLVLGYLLLPAVLVPPAYGWVLDAAGPIDWYLRAVLVGTALLVGVCALPVVAKWTLVGRWRQQQIQLWSLSYVRFWAVKTLVRTNPLVRFAGSPLYVLYLRALGARIGRGAVIFSRHVPVCTDLLTIGDRTVVRKDAFLTCYRARVGVLETGTVDLGSDVVVGESTVLDIDTSMGDRSRLGHSSSLQRGQAVPAAARWHGSTSPQTGEADLPPTGLVDTGRFRRVGYSAWQLGVLLLVTGPAGTAAVMALLAVAPQVGTGLGTVLGTGPGSGWTVAGDLVLWSLVSFCAVVVAGLLLVGTVPRLLNLVIRPDRDYPLYGVHYLAHRAIARLTNIPFYPRLLGDSSYVVPYLQWLGYDLPKVEQTGSNFGLEVKHETPFHVTIGSGTMAADGLSIVNADFTSTTFRVSRARIGAQSFLGNYIAYPSQATVGDDVLLATKARIPVEGHVRAGVGLLGSPEFEIPRSVQRDGKFDHLGRGDELRRRLTAKDRHNAVTIGLYLLSRWAYVFGLTLLAWAAVTAYGTWGAPALAVANLAALTLGVCWFALVERVGTGRQPLQARYCSIYDPYFWWHERTWKLAKQPLVLDGTPFKTLVWRLLGVRIGARVFDDGCAIVEKSLVTIGDDSALNVRSIVQAHSQEDGAFKSDHIVIGARCTLGTGSLVHYGTTMGDDATLAPDAFLMKGEEVPGRASWGGNPAREMR